MINYKLKEEIKNYDINLYIDYIYLIYFNFDIIWVIYSEYKKEL